MVGFGRAAVVLVTRRRRARAAVADGGARRRRATAAPLDWRCERALAAIQRPVGITRPRESARWAGRSRLLSNAVYTS